MPPSFVTHVQVSNGAQVVSVRASGSSLSPGQIGKIIDSTSGYVTCVLADSTDTGADEEKYVYILENISAGTNGDGIIKGTITGVDTSIYTAPYVWLNASGTLSNTPSGGLVQLGKVNEAAVDGTIWFDGNPRKSLPVDPVYWGADPTGTNPSSSAINSAWAYAVSKAYNKQKSGSAIQTGRPSVDLLPGQYKVDATITVSGRFRCVGGTAILFDDTDTVTLVQSSAFNHMFEDIHFHRGAIAYEALGGNADQRRVSFNRCNFSEQATYSIHIPLESRAGIYSINQCYFSSLTDTGSKVLYAPGGDLVAIHHSRIDACNDITFDIGDAQVRMTECKLTPSGVSPNNGVWFRLANGSQIASTTAAGSLSLNRVRVGGESGGRKTLDSYSATGEVNISQSQVFSPSGAPAISFYEVPRQIKMRDNGGLTAGRGIRFESTISDASIADIGESKLIDIEGFSTGLLQGLALGGAAKSEEATHLALAKGLQDYHGGLNAAAPLISIPVDSGAFGVSLTGTSVTSTTVDGPYGSKRRRIVSSATGASYSIVYSTGLASLASGLYTLVFELDVIDKCVTLFPEAGDTLTQVSLNVGRHTICLPFRYISGTTSQRISLSSQGANLPNGAIFERSAIRVLSGWVRVNNGEVLRSESDSLTPAMGAGNWQKGDRLNLGTSWLQGGGFLEAVYDGAAYRPAAFIEGATRVSSGFPYTIGAAERYILVNNGTGAGVTVNLHASPRQGQRVTVKDSGQNAGTHTITIGRNGNNIDGAASDITITANGGSVELIYDSTDGWLTI